tara:strand:+ start:8180 stop:9346 length:1167 start_codon:yes stop_codon:yes gene_type:complete
MADKKITDLAALTTPASADLFAIVDSSEAAAANKNKSITFANIHRLLPAGSAGSPALSFIDDSSVTGIYRSAANELGFAANSVYQGAFTTSGLKLGTGTEAAQFHLFSTDTTDQVIIENTDAGADTAPDLVLFRNSATPAANDNLGNIEFRGEDNGGNAHAYAQITAGIQTVANGSEDGYLDLMSSASGTTASRLRLYNQYVGVGELTPAYPLHLTTSITGTAFRSECNANDAASGGDITMFHRRGASGPGQDSDILSTLFYRGKNDNATPQEVDYVAIEGSIVDASDTTEDSALKVKVRIAGTLTTQLEINSNTLGFFGKTAATQATALTDITTTASSGSLPAASDTNTIANAAAPTNAELLKYCVTLEGKVEALIDALQRHGLMAT